MGTALRWVHAAVSWLYVATILFQVFLAGLALVNLGGSGDFRNHADFGYTAVGIAALALVLTAAAAWASRRDIAITLGLVVLYIVQTSLPLLRASVPSVAALHPVNAMVLFGLSAWYAHHATGSARVASAESEAAAVR